MEASTEVDISIWEFPLMAEVEASITLTVSSTTIFGGSFNELTHTPINFHLVQQVS